MVFKPNPILVARVLIYLSSRDIFLSQIDDCKFIAGDNWHQMASGIG